MRDRPTKVLTLPEAVCLRPKMYTLGGTIEELSAFFEGYFSGLARADLSDARVRRWNSFCEHLKSDLQVEDTRQAFARLRLLHGSNEEAIADLYNRIARFRSENPVAYGDEF